MRSGVPTSHLRGTLAFFILTTSVSGQEPPRAEVACRVALNDLQQFPSDEAKFKRYLDWSAVPSEANLAGPGGAAIPFRPRERYQRVMRWWINQLSFNRAMLAPDPVGEFLWRIDLRDGDWNAAAWEAVAEREPFTIEPYVNPATSQALKDLIGCTIDTRSAVAVIRADWLFRDSIETERSPTYYDLLFARKRFVPGGKGTKKVERSKEVEHKGGDYTYPDGRIVKNVAPGTYTVRWDEEVPDGSGFKFVDFPATVDDWNKAFGIADFLNFSNENEINLKLGAVVAGSEDDPVKGSFVARNNRVVEIIRGPFGVNLRTYDAERTAGDKDYLENSPDVALGDIQFDAGELLASLPNGGQAGFLIDGAGKRQELADGRFTHNRGDRDFRHGGNPALARFVDVRTMMGCVTCHAHDHGFIPPKDLVKDMLVSGVDVKFKDREKRNQFRAFFEGWDVEIQGYQAPYRALVERTTTVGGKAWTGAELSNAYLEFRDWYDSPVTATQAAYEVGQDEKAFLLSISKSPTARLSLMLRGRPMPRTVWDDQGYDDASLLNLSNEK